MRPIVVHCKKSEFDVYIGRNSRDEAAGWEAQFTGSWGNPFLVANRPQGRSESIANYRKWLWREISEGRCTLDDLRSLAGKRIACWCNPQPCHGDVLADAAEWALKQD